MTKKIIEVLKGKGYKISFAESCTGGFLASSLTNIDGSSCVFSESYVCYSEEAKKRTLKISEETLLKYSVYSQEVALEMVQNLAMKTGAELCISTTGLAGCDDFCYQGKLIKSGTVFIGIKYLNFCDVIEAEFSSHNKSEFKEKVYLFISEFIERIL